MLGLLGSSIGPTAVVVGTLCALLPDGLELDVVGMAVGAPYAVLVAEQLAASGAELVVSVTSAGQLAPLPATPCFVVIDRALRDEGI